MELAFVGDSINTRAMAKAKEALADVLQGVETTKERKRDYATEDAGRSSVLFQLRVKQTVADRADADAERYGMNRSKYVGSLIMGATPPPPPSLAPGSDTLLLAMAGNPVLRAIVAVRKRIEGGEGDAASLIPELRSIQRAIAMGQLSLRADYDKGLDDRLQADKWSDNESPELPTKQARKTP